jgi:hypothetical protein
MKSVKQILDHLNTNTEKLEIGDLHEIQNTGYMNLTIEKIGSNRISVAHYHQKRGDLMSDPEIVFKITDKNQWIPITYTQHPGIYEHDENGLHQVQKFCKHWNHQLKKQGYIQAVKNKQAC